MDGTAHLDQLLIIKTGSAVSEVRNRHGDFDCWFRQAMNLAEDQCRVVSVHDDQDLPSPHMVAAALVTGSPAMVSHRADWSERTAAWLRGFHALDRPLLGVCYGHQLIAHALGGKVGPNPCGRRMGTCKIDILDADDPLLGPCHPVERFQLTHVEVVLEPPPGARIIARADHDPHHGLHFGKRSWGVQFHPEFDREIMAAYIQSRASVLAGEGIAAQPLLDALDASPGGQSVLVRFCRMIDAARRSYPIDEAASSP
ncbi:MAG: glutamine amidotransferase [Wenzhouxiangellaceae bacterium]|nr:MAG: glutamine amidotransferase [Wenzhouxiangellaceae bacterium]